MKVAVVVPFRPVDEARAAAWERVRRHLKQVLPDADLVVCDDGGEPFSRAASLNAGVAATDADVIVSHDADVLVSRRQLEAAIKMASDADGLVVPFDHIIYVGEGASSRLIESDSIPSRVSGHKVEMSDKVPMLGTVGVMSRNTWHTAGGWVEAHRGWGCEDVSFAAQCGTLAGPLRRVPGRVVHLHHEKTGEYNAAATRTRNGEVMRRVLAADGNPDLMRATLADLATAPAPEPAAPRDRFVILAAGPGTRWNNHFGAPKHFAQLLGETLIDRVARQVRDRVPDPDLRVVVADVNDTRYQHLGRLEEATQHPEMKNAAKIVSSRHVWNPDGRTVILLGDVWYSDEAMDRIVGYGTGEWALFGRPTGSKTTGKKWNENFALVFWPADHDTIVAGAERAVKLKAAGHQIRLSHSTWFRSTVGVPDHVVGVWDTNPQRFGHFQTIDDWTDDIDSPQEWETWCYKWATAPPDQRPAAHA